MNEHSSSHDAFDARMRELHARSLATLPSPTLARLREARQAGGRPRRLPAWLLATACSAVLAIGFGLQLHRGDLGPSALPQVPATAAATGTDDDTLDQNPDLYVWLGSENALAME
ncbi:MAG: hypothetical protein ABN502_00300 [Gammaproteobacteria bacterium]